MPPEVNRAKHTPIITEQIDWRTEISPNPRILHRFGVANQWMRQGVIDHQRNAHIGRVLTNPRASANYFAFLRKDRVPASATMRGFLPIA